MRASPKESALSPEPYFLKKYQNTDVFEKKKNADIPSPHQNYDSSRDLQPRAKAPDGQTYTMFESELEALHTYI